MDNIPLEEFKALSGLLQFYLGLVLQTVTMAMTVTSAVVAYLVKSEGTPRRRALALSLPAALCGGLGVGFLGQRSATQELRDRLVVVAGKLGFGLAPHGEVLVSAVTWLGALLIVTALALVTAAMVNLLQARPIATGPESPLNDFKAM
jgi:hypothetical protein